MQHVRFRFASNGREHGVKSRPRHADATFGAHEGFEVSDKTIARLFSSRRAAGQLGGASPHVLLSSVE